MSYVKVLNENDSPVNFEGRKDNVFDSINEAINALSKVHNGSYKINLLRHFFDEYVIIPPHLDITFITDCKNCCIRAVKSNRVYNARFHFKINIQHIVDGKKTNVFGTFYRINFKKSDMPINSDVMSLTLTRKCLEVFEVGLSSIKSVFNSIDGKTTNLQVLLPKEVLIENLQFIQKNMKNLDDSIKKENIVFPPDALNINEAQELIENVIDKPWQRIDRINQLVRDEGLLLVSGFDNIGVNANPENEDYRIFLHEIFSIIQELLYACNYLLKRVIANLNALDKDSYFYYRLMIIEELFKDVIIKFKGIYMYVHSLGGNNAVLAKGEDSSVSVLELAEQSLRGPNKNECKKALIGFLNERNITVSADATNEDLINTLRDYTSNAPDADYMIIRFMKNNARIFAVISFIASFIPWTNLAMGIRREIKDIRGKKGSYLGGAD